MSLFSETLKGYVEKNHISVSKLSVEMNMDRTLFHKYLSGIRTPKSFLEVQNIGRSMMLLPNQQELLLESYAKSIYGEESYQSFKKIRQMLEGMYDLRILHGKKQTDAEISMELFPVQEDVTFYGKLQVEDALIRLFYRAVSESGGACVTVKMIMQPDLEHIMQTLLRLSGCFCLEFEHIVCLDCKRNNNDNIGLLFPILAFEFSETSYQSYFYYENMDYRRNSMRLLPNLILIGTYAFLCSSKADECLIIGQAAEVEFFRRNYEQVKRETEKLGIANQNAIMLEETLQFGGNEEAIDLKIGSFPCLTAGISEAMFRQHFHSNLEEKEKVLSLVNQNQAYLMGKHTFCCYFSEYGLRKFLKDGRLPEYPADIFEPFSVKERILIVNRLIQLLKAGAFSFYIADEHQFPMDGAVTIYAGSRGSVHFWLNHGVYGQTVTVKESGIGENVHNFAEFAEKTGWFYGAKETIARMEEIVFDFSNS